MSSLAASTTDPSTALATIWFNLVDNSNSNSKDTDADNCNGKKEEERKVLVSSSGRSYTGSNMLPVKRLEQEKPTGTGTGTGTGTDTDPDLLPKKKRIKQDLSEERRRQRNAKEQARSNRLSQQFDDLREILNQAGIVVPKGTKGCVLAASLEYIKVLQSNNNHKEM